MATGKRYTFVCVNTFFLKSFTFFCHLPGKFNIFFIHFTHNTPLQLIFNSLDFHLFNFCFLYLPINLFPRKQLHTGTDTQKNRTYIFGHSDWHLIGNKHLSELIFSQWVYYSKRKASPKIDRQFTNLSRKKFLPFFTEWM